MVGTRRRLVLVGSGVIDSICCRMWGEILVMYFFILGILKHLNSLTQDIISLLKLGYFNFELLDFGMCCHKLFSLTFNLKVGFINCWDILRFVLLWFSFCIKLI